jgi:hypothetical protein
MDPFLRLEDTSGKVPGPFSRRAKGSLVLKVQEK